MTYKPQNDLPKMEDYQANTLYAITINPRLQHPDSSKRLKDVVHEASFSYLHKIMLISDVKLYPEMSPTGRVHFHGTIKILKKNIFNFYSLIHKYIGVKDPTFTLVIKQITDDEWKTYITKQKDLIKPVCKEYNIPYPINNHYVKLLQHNKAAVTVSYDLTKYRV